MKWSVGELLRRPIRFCQPVTVLFGALAALPCAGQQMANDAISVSVDARLGTYDVAFAGGATVFGARAGALVDHHWLHCTDYPRRVATRAPFRDILGAGEEISVACRGLPREPEFVYSLRVYERQSYATVQVKLRNTSERKIAVQALRGVEAVGKDILALGAPAASDRVLSDSFSEDWPEMKICDLGKAPGGLHRGVGSQLVYNRASGESFFVGALSSERFLTVIHLQAAVTGAEITALSADATGTTEIQRDFDLKDSPPANQVELSVAAEPGEEVAGEPLLLEVGPNYLDQLRHYAEAVQALHGARVAAPTPIGWWSWTAFYAAINEGETLENADWQSRHLASLGYKYFQVDEGYQYARGEYLTSNAVQFPSGMRAIGRHVTADGLVFGVWTAPFEVTSRAWVYEHHKEWLVRNARGEPIHGRKVFEESGQDSDTRYALDTTHPGAQEYLRQTYRTMVREWGVRFIKLDFMDTTAVEGFRYRPNTTALEAQRIGLKIIRDAVGDDVILDKDGSPMLNVVGIVDTGRISQDTAHTFEATREAATGIAARFYMNRRFFISDPDAFNTTPEQFSDYPEITPGLPLAAAEASIALSAVSGGMYEIGDDMLVLGSNADRLALVQNTDLLNMAKLARASTPLDLLSYRAEDGQPSVFFLRETPRQSILTVFNWTKEPRSRTLRLADLGLPTDHAYTAADVLRPGTTRTVRDASVELNNQVPESVIVLKLLDTSVDRHAPGLVPTVPASASAGEPLEVSARGQSGDWPVIDFRWDFGDGSGAEGAHASHTFTRAGDFLVRLTGYGVDGSQEQMSFPVRVSGILHATPNLRTNRRLVEPEH